MEDPHVGEINPCWVDDYRELLKRLPGLEPIANLQGTKRIETLIYGWMMLVIRIVTVCSVTIEPSDNMVVGTAHLIGDMCF